MAPLVPTNFPPATPDAIATYDATDFADGTGIVKFYFATTNDSVGLSYVLTRDQSYSWYDADEAGAKTGVETVVNATTSDIDYDLSQFQISRVIEGTALAIIGYQLEDPAGGATGTILVKIRKWNAATSTETEIANKTSNTVAATGPANSSGTLSIPITIPRTRLGKGDTLRVTLFVTGTSGSLSYGHDPQNRDGTIVIPSTDKNITASYINIPFNIKK